MYVLLQRHEQHSAPPMPTAAMQALPHHSRQQRWLRTHCASGCLWRLATRALKFRTKKARRIQQVRECNRVCCVVRIERGVAKRPGLNELDVPEWAGLALDKVEWRKQLLQRIAL
jgi:hypothetical protein